MKRLILGLGIVALFGMLIAFGSPRTNAQCDPCVNCSADPVFIQLDARQPHMIAVLRSLASKKMQEQGVSHFVVLEERSADTSGRIPVRKSLVLVGSQGTVESTPLTKELPVEAKALLP